MIKYLILLVLVFGCSSDPKKDSPDQSGITVTDGESGGEVGSFDDSGTGDMSPEVESDEQFREKLTKDYGEFKEAIRKMNLAAAKKAAAQHFSDDSEDAYVLSELASLCFKKANYRLSHYYLSRLLRSHPNNLPGLYLRGVLKWREGEPDVALTFFHKVYQVDPEFRSVAINLATIYEKAGVYTKVIKFLDPVYANSGDLQVGLSLAQAHLGLKQWSQAQAIYEKFLGEKSFEQLSSMANGLSVADGYLRVLQAQPDMIAQKQSEISEISSLQNSALSQRAQKLLSNGGGGE